MKRKRDYVECDTKFKADCVRGPYEGCSKSWKNIHTVSVKEHIAFKCKFIVDGKTKINEFYQRRKKKSFLVKL